MRYTLYFVALTLSISLAAISSTSGIEATNNLKDFPYPFVLGGILNTTFVVGSTNPHGPLNWKAWTVDVLAGIAIGSTLSSEASTNPYVAQTLDSDVASYDEKAGIVTADWGAIATKSMISIGSGAVNLISLYYNDTLPYQFIQDASGAHIYSNQTRTSYSSHGSVDYAVIAGLNESNVGPVLLVFGVTGKGTLAASLILQNHQQFAQLLVGQSIIMQWQDLNGNNTPDLNDQYALIEWS